MDDAALVGHLHGARQRLDELGGRPRTRRALADPLVEAASLHELQRKIGPAFVLAGLVDLHDVGMKQLGDGFRLGAKPRQAHLTDMRSRQDHLQGDQALQPAVPRLVDDAHAAPAEFFQDVITRHGHALESRGAGEQTDRHVGPGGVKR